MLGNDGECVMASPFAKKAQAQVVRKCGSSAGSRQRADHAGRSAGEMTDEL
jgi:hypothetical protein